MWRAIFLALGCFMGILGIQALGVEKATLKIREPVKQEEAIFGQIVAEKPAQGPKRTIVPPEWAPWSLMSTGAIVCLYSFTIPARVKGK